MKNIYMKPIVEVVKIEMPFHLLSGSDISGGGDKGTYVEGTQEGRYNDLDDDF